MSEGPASCLAHDHMAAETGFADVLWWTDHDFRVANFAKFRRCTFTGLAEEIDHPNRDPEALERVGKTTLAWKPAGGEVPEHGVVEPSTAVAYGEGGGALRFALPVGGADERRCLYELQVGAHYETFPLLTRPVLRLAILPQEGVGPDGQVLLALTLSEQPPDLVNTRLTYALGGPAARTVVTHGEHGASAATIGLPFTPGRWNEYRLDLLADVQRLGLRGGADNALHRLRLGVASRGPAVEAYFGSLEVEVAHRGPAVLDLHRRLLAELPLRVRHYVGLEVSYYGRHVTGFGAAVPIPDYEALLPRGLTTEEVVAHIHQHGGLACLAHPPRVDPETTAAQLAERRLYGADLMEVAHSGAGLADRLRLWDLLARRGLVVTGIGVSDAHSAKEG